MKSCKALHFGGHAQWIVSINEIPQSASILKPHSATWKWIGWHSLDYQLAKAHSSHDITLTFGTWCVTQRNRPTLLNAPPDTITTPTPTFLLLSQNGMKLIDERVRLIVLLDTFRWNVCQFVSEAWPGIGLGVRWSCWWWEGGSVLRSRSRVQMGTVY